MSLLMGLNASTDDEVGVASSLRPFEIAWLLAESGSLPEARQCAEEFVARSRTRSAPLDEARGRWVLAEVLRRSGELDAASTEIQTALSMLGMVSRLDVPGALATQAALRLAQGRFQDALAAADEGMARMQAMGACSVFFREAFLRLVHAECLEATGDHAAARAAIAGARDYLSMIEGKILDPAYRQSFLEEVPENRRICELAQQWGIARAMGGDTFVLRTNTGVDPE
jgi:ATP/maltotriose-dependent transcriptional regulator MalT